MWHVCERILRPAAQCRWVLHFDVIFHMLRGRSKQPPTRISVEVELVRRPYAVDLCGKCIKSAAAATVAALKMNKRMWLPPPATCKCVSMRVCWFMFVWVAFMPASAAVLTPPWMIYVKCEHYADPNGTATTHGQQTLSPLRAPFSCKHFQSSCKVIYRCTNLLHLQVLWLLLRWLPLPAVLCIFCVWQFLQQQQILITLQSDIVYNVHVCIHLCTGECIWWKLVLLQLLLSLHYSYLLCCKSTLFLMLSAPSTVVRSVQHKVF